MCAACYLILTGFHLGVHKLIYLTKREKSYSNPKVVMSEFLKQTSLPILPKIQHYMKLAFSARFRVTEIMKSVPKSDTGADTLDFLAFFFPVIIIL